MALSAYQPLGERMLDLTRFDILESPLPDVGDLDSHADATASLRAIADALGLAHATYLSVPQGESATDIDFATTYSSDWTGRYLEKEYQSIDPVVKLTRNRLLPLDWSTIVPESASTRDFLGEAIEFGVGEQGISILIRGPNRDTALFSATMNCDARYWNAVRRNLVAALQIVGHEFHKSLVELESSSKDGSQVYLSKREREVLQWASEGKTIWETARILGIASTTTKQYMMSAIYKLNCVNKVHAVARAIRLRLI